MATATDRIAALMDGPPPRAPERVVEGMALRGRRIVVNAEDGSWVGDIRATDPPYWYDEQAENPARSRWLPGQPVPEGADPARARLFVAACTERDWYEWARTKRRPQIGEYPAYLVWVE